MLYPSLKYVSAIWKDSISWNYTLYKVTYKMFENKYYYAWFTLNKIWHQNIDEACNVLLEHDHEHDDWFAQ